MIAVFTLPRHLESASNARDNKWEKARKTKAGVSLGWTFAAKLHSQMRQRSLVAERRRVLFVRIGKKKLDDDNIRGAFKAIRDGVAKFFEVDDGNEERWQWEYAQEKGPYAIRVEYEVLS